MHSVSNRDTHSYLPHSNSSIQLTVTTESPNGMRSGRTTTRDSVLLSPTPAPTLLGWPCQKKHGSGSTASAPVSDVSTPACPTGVWLPLRFVSVAKNNKPSTMSSSNFQSIELLMDCTTWRFWMMRQLNGCPTPTPRSCVAKQWIVTIDWNHEKVATKMMKVNRSQYIFTIYFFVAYKLNTDN